MNTFFVADTHFGHAKIIEHSKRPFSSVEVMDESLIENWNKIVTNKDDVYHLGDFNFRSKKSTEEYRSQLNGRIHLILGNHDDKYAKRDPVSFDSMQEVLYLRLNGEKIYLSHYAHRVWRNSHHGSWHLYGHSHGSIPHYHKSLDVGVDVWGYRPVSFEEIKTYMDTQSKTKHHPEGK